MGRNPDVGLHPREDDQPPCQGEGASGWDGDEVEDLACLPNKSIINQKETEDNYECRKKKL